MNRFALAHILLVVGLGIAPLSHAPIARANTAEPIRVTYVTIESVYVSAGKKAGLAAGDTLRVTQGEHAGVLLVVTTVSSHSAACRTLESAAVVAVDDLVVPLHPREIPPAVTESPSAPLAAAESTSTRLPSGVATAGAAGKTLLTEQFPMPDTTPPSAAGAGAGGTAGAAPRARSKNQLHGYIDLEYQLLYNVKGTVFSWHQPGASGRIIVDNLAGTGLSLRYRQVSRWSYRDYSLSGSIDQHEYVQRLTELALVYGRYDSPIEAGFGRTLLSYIRGTGYVDGGYIVYRFAGHYRLGMTGGTEPDPENSKFSTENSKAAVFAAYETGSHDRHWLASTIAASGSYHTGTVGREFIYMQNAYSYARRFSAYQSLEVDLNRDWRKEAAGSSLTFSNFYLTSNVILNSKATIDFSFDARRPVRDYHTMDTPDSLFDDSIRRGVSGGLSVLVANNTRLRVYGGVERGENDNKTNYASAYVTVRNLIWSTDNLSARLSWSDAPDTRTYGPVIAYRTQLARRTYLNVGSGAYLSSTRGVDDNNYYIQVNGDQWFGRRYSLSASLRRYFGGSLASLEVGAKLGLSF